MANASVQDAGVVVVGNRPKPLQDLYHLWLRTAWPRAILLIATVYLAVNALFALMYLYVGGSANFTIYWTNLGDGTLAAQFIEQPEK